MIEAHFSNICSSFKLRLHISPQYLIHVRFTKNQSSPKLLPTEALLAPALHHKEKPPSTWEYASVS
jgi:hypothetical protein